MQQQQWQQQQQQLQPARYSGMLSMVAGQLSYTSRPRPPIVLVAEAWQLHLRQSSQSHGINFCEMLHAVRQLVAAVAATIKPRCISHSAPFPLSIPLSVPFTYPFYSFFLTLSLYILSAVSFFGSYCSCCPPKTFAAERVTRAAWHVTRDKVNDSKPTPYQGCHDDEKNGIEWIDIGKIGQKTRQSFLSLKFHQFVSYALLTMF